jgi:hypothetical protein
VNDRPPTAAEVLESYRVFGRRAAIFKMALKDNGFSRREIAGMLSQFVASRYSQAQGPLHRDIATPSQNGRTSARETDSSASLSVLPTMGSAHPGRQD